MILRGDREMVRPAGADSAPLDDLFRRAGVQSADAPAMIDPPNRASFTHGAPRRLTYAQADRAISTLAARLCRLGLQTDAVVAIQLPNTVESVITLLAVLRAGMIAVPLPLLWRSYDLRAALAHVGAKAIITTSRVGDVDHAKLAVQVAAELFPVRFVCAYGEDLPDGVIALDDIFTSDQNVIVPRSVRTGHAADHVAVVTFDVTTDGLVAVPRSHAQLIAGSTPLIPRATAANHTNILSAIPASSFAGLAVSVLPWLQDGGTLSLHHGFDSVSFFAQCLEHSGGRVVLPGPALGIIGSAANLSVTNTKAVALWRSPEQLASAPGWRSGCALIDVACFGEIGLIATHRGDDGLPADIPLNAGGGVIESKRTKHGTLALRGAMLPTHSFPLGAASGLVPGDDGFIDTGFTCKLDAPNQTLTISGPPGSITVIGGYRFKPADLDFQVNAADAAATIVALPGGMLAERLAGRALDPVAVRTRLLENGANPLIAEAFRPRGTANAA
ncbi:MAG: class I adenylate-forming enzyme family protein [Pseudolabrys sp.]|nr:class I adenylate-forming enzyme family protein [Pseudolabrys sp.]